MKKTDEYVWKKLWIFQILFQKLPKCSLLVSIFNLLEIKHFNLFSGRFYFFDGLNLQFFSEKVGKLLKNGDGIAFEVSEANGVLKSFETKYISISVFCNMWGTYLDVLTFNIEGIKIIWIFKRLKIEFWRTKTNQDTSWGRGVWVTFKIQTCCWEIFKSNFKIWNKL